MALSLATNETDLPGLEAGTAITTTEGLSIQKSDSSKKALPRKGSLRRGLLCIDSTVKRRLRCERYFLRQGYRCLATDDLQEGLAIRDATAPDAVILMGTNLSDEEVAGFHQSHNSRPDAQPLFMVLPEEQSKRLNGRIHTPGSHILNSPIRLGNLHREIRITLTDAKQATAEASAAVTEP